MERHTEIYLEGQMREIQSWMETPRSTERGTVPDIRWSSGTSGCERCHGDRMRHIGKERDLGPRIGTVNE